MADIPTLGGIIPPVPTPFDAAGKLDLGGLQRVLHALAPQVDGFLVLGSNGEAVYLAEDERREVLAAAREAIPRDKPMIAGTGGEATWLVAERNRLAAEAGADCVLVLPPFYYQGRMNDETLATHYEALAGSCSVPLLLYNVPANTTIGLSPALIERLAGHENIHGLKDSSGNIVALTEIMRRVPEEFTVLTGNAPTLLPALSLGARGGILAVANVAPQAYGAILKHFQRGEIAEARALQLRTNPLALAVTARYGVAGLKAAMRARGLPAGYPRAPLRDVSEAQGRELGALLEGQGLARGDIRA
ncbi:dihydrodipicolinate synthase family protein [soil metagenome]